MTPDLRRIKLRHLLAFVEVVRSLSLTKAAIALHVTVPAVSKTLHELQDALGMALFTQLQGGIVLSPEGRAFAKHAESGVQMLLRGVAAATDPAAAQARTLAIAAAPTVAATFLPDVLAELEERAPVATMSIATGTNAQLLRMLHHHEVEVVIGRVTAATELAGITFEHLYDDDVVLVARAEHPLLRRARRKLADIARFTLIIPPADTAIREEIDRWFASSGIAQPSRRVETPYLQLSKKLLLRADAIWFISRRVVAEELARGEMKLVFDKMPALATPIGILTRSDVPPEPAAANLIEAARAVVARGFG